MNTCDNCIFYVALPDMVVCVADKKGYSCIAENCKYRVEYTPENAERELKKLKKQ